MWRQVAMDAPALHPALTRLAATRPRIILGSASSSRRQILEELLRPHQLGYEVLTAGIDEKAIRRPTPTDLVLALAHAKAQAIRAKLTAAGGATSGYLLTCDQVVVHEGRILEKPESQEEAREFIAGYARSPASTVGSVVCTDLHTGRTVEGVDTAHIHFSPIPAASVEQLLAEGECMYCAGGLMVEHPLVVPHVLKIDGTQDSVMGLSAALVVRLLLECSGLLDKSQTQAHSAA